VGGSRWILAESMPGSATTLASASVGCGSAAALYLLILRPAGRPPFGQFGRAALGGALVITGPLLVLLHPGSIPAANVTMALALTPVVIAVIEAATQHSSQTLAGRLWPGLATIAGLLLLLAQPSLPTRSTT
jgi:drug/metabolite transporter (DMT)-like permease